MKTTRKKEGSCWLTGTETCTNKGKKKKKKKSLHRSVKWGGGGARTGQPTKETPATREKDDCRGKNRETDTTPC